MFKYFIIILSIIAFSSSCRKQTSNNCPTEFRPNGNVKPYDSSYSIGDTLSLYSHYHYLVYEESTNSYYDLSKVDNIKSALMIYNMDTVCDNLDASLSDFIEIISNDKYNYTLQTFSTGNESLYSNIILDSDTFRNEIKIVFKKKGLFMLVYGLNSIENSSDFEGKCNRYDFNVFTKLNNGYDNNINLLEQSPDEYFNNWILKKPGERFYRGCFAYKVD